MRGLLTLIAVIGLGSCSSSKTMSEPTPPTPSNAYVVISTNAEARSEVGAVVRATGVVQREKPGDAVVTSDLDILCPDYRFADEHLGAEVTIEGTLRQIQLPEATVDADGAVSQGVRPGSPPRFAIDDCTVVTGET